MGQRSRKRRPDPGAERDAAMRRGYARGRERDERIRAELEPYAPGERPAAIKAAVAFTSPLRRMSRLSFRSSVAPTPIDD